MPRNISSLKVCIIKIRINHITITLVKKVGPFEYFWVARHYPASTIPLGVRNKNPKKNLQKN